MCSRRKVSPSTRMDRYDFDAFYRIRSTISQVVRAAEIEIAETFNVPPEQLDAAAATLLHQQNQGADDQSEIYSTIGEFVIPKSKP